MKNIKYSFSVIFLMLLLYSCNKEESKIVTNDKLTTRSIAKINAKTLSWLDNFRLDLVENNQNEYSVEDAMAGMDVILNLYKTQGVGSFIQYDIEQRDYTVPLNQSGKITTDALRILFESVYDNNKNQYLNSSLPNKILGNINIDIKAENQTSVVMTVKTVIGSEDLDDDSQPSLDDDCAKTFGPGLCFKAGDGDADFIKYITTTYSTSSPLEGGGKCDGTLVDKTAAHEEVQKKFSRKIAKSVNIKKGKFESTYIIKYVNEECEFIDIGRNGFGFNTFSGCSETIMNDNVFPSLGPITTYNTDELNCAHCIINNWINYVIPAGNQMSHINIFTANLGFSSKSNKWIVEVCWGEPVLVPLEQPFPIPTGDDTFMRGPSPTIKDVSIITNTNPYNNLNLSISNIINQ